MAAPVLIGFKILAINGQETAIRNLLGTILLVPDEETISNIIRHYDITNIWPSPWGLGLISEEVLAQLPFPTEPIYTTPNVTCISNVDFKVELPYKDHQGVERVLVLLATEYADITLSMYQQFKWYRENAYIRTIPFGGSMDLITGDFTVQDFEPSDFHTS